MIHILFSMVIQAQHTIQIRIADVPSSGEGEDIYLSGNFNNWQPGEERMKLHKNSDGSYGIELAYTDIPGKRVELKFTRGTWQKSECTQTGRLTGPRILPLNRDTSVVYRIEGWRDDFPPHTKSDNVHLLDSAFYMPQLDRHRRIWIYLPEDYASSNKRYPVIYMHDGQHLFDEATSVGRIGPIEWAVDETLDESDHPCIIVAIDHNPDMKERSSEYYYYPNEPGDTAEGQAYLSFIVHTLKPYVDRNYRTLSSKEHTAIAGSSMGGLISLYGAIHYPEVFGQAGILSPSVWLDKGHIEKEISGLRKKKIFRGQQYFFYAGAEEQRRKDDGTFVNMVDDVNTVIRGLRRKAKPHIALMVNPHGRHGALYWREAFPEFFRWFTENHQVTSNPKLKLVHQ